jgi:signal transduction histidine kinase
MDPHPADRSRRASRMADTATAPAPSRSIWSRPGVVRGVVIVGGWTLVALFLFSKYMAGRLLRDDPTPWQDMLVAWLLGSYISAALTPGILWLGDRFPIRRRPFPRHIAVHVAGGVAFTVAQLALEAAITVWTGVVSFPSTASFGVYFRVLIVLGFHGSFLSYWLVVGLQALWQFTQESRRHEREALELMARAATLETQVVQARLGALKMQLQPHFLFNTLNAVVSLVRARRGREAEDTLAHLSDLLRWVLDDREQQEVPLARELEYVRLYLAVEGIRFADRLRVDYRIAPDALDGAVPHLCLQPIVENAIRHGVEASAAAGAITISAERDGDVLALTVEDDGPGFGGGPGVPGRRQPVGIGLANTRLRLAELYGARASLSTANAPAGGAIVTIRVPFRECEDAATPARAEACL